MHSMWIIAFLVFFFNAQESIGVNTKRQCSRDMVSKYLPKSMNNIHGLWQVAYFDTIYDFGKRIPIQQIMLDGYSLTEIALNKE